MWGDIALAYRDIVPKLPKDLIVLSWGYDARASFDDMIKPFTEIGFRFMVCPGVSCWSQIYPDIDNATVNISNFTRDGARLGAIGMLNTTWDDSGENLFGSNWYPLLWGAECAWKPAIPKDGEDPNKVRDARAETFAEAFDGVFFGMNGDQATRLILGLLLRRGSPGFGAMTDSTFWWDLKRVSRETNRGQYAALVEGSARLAAQALEEQKRKARHNADALDYAAFAARKIEFMGERALAAINVKFADNPDSRVSARDELAQSAKDAPGLRDEYVRLWNLENRPWWLDRNLAKYDKLIAELDVAPDTPVLAPEGTTFSGSIDVSIHAMTDGYIRYTTDGSEPTLDLPIYSGPIHLEKTTVVKARLFRDSRPVGAVATETYRALTLPAKFETALPTYEDCVPANAFDGDESTFFWCSRQANAGETFTVVLDKPAPLKSIRVVTGHPDHPQDFVHEGVVEISTDGSTFSPAAVFKDGIAEGTLGGKDIKAIRIRLTQDNGFWLVIREIEVE
jgi:hexosaminidase